LRFCLGAFLVAWRVGNAADADRVTETIKRELRRRSAVEPVIGHTKAEHRMGRNYLAGTHGDTANAVLAAAGYNFRRLLEWLALLLSAILAALRSQTEEDPSAAEPFNRQRVPAQAVIAVFTGDKANLRGPGASRLPKRRAEGFVAGPC
jgi:Transposase DDE domain